MDDQIKMVRNQQKAKHGRSALQFNRENARGARRFHESFPEYRKTPLRSLTGLAAQLGLGAIYVKDESCRFGLNAFKVLGGSYAIGRYIAKRIGENTEFMTYDSLITRPVRDQIKNLTFVTATDGNHGRGVAWTANRLGLRAVVYMPEGSAEERLENIRALGAEAAITDLNYDDAVRLAASQAEKHGWTVVQDTAWDGYEEIPTWIMQGYTTMGVEIVDQLEEMGWENPTHIVLQAGVGAMAGAMTGFFSDYYQADMPVVVIAEPERADCIYRTAEAGDGQLHSVKGRMDTIMAGLACGEPCSLGWEVLKEYADYFVSMPDYVAANGMRILGNPVGADPRVVSGESGAAAFGLAAELMRNEKFRKLRAELGLNEESRVLCISTEGDTDRENYRRIVWDGYFAPTHKSYDALHIIACRKCL